MHNAIALAVAAIMVGMSCGSPQVADIPMQEKVRIATPLAYPAEGLGAAGLDWTGLAKAVTLLGGPEGTLVLGPPSGAHRQQARWSSTLPYLLHLLWALKIGLGQPRPSVPGRTGVHRAQPVRAVPTRPSGHSANAFAICNLLAQVSGRLRCCATSHWRGVEPDPTGFIGIRRCCRGGVWADVGEQVVQGRLHLLELDGMRK